MNNVRLVMDMYTANRDYEAMIIAVEDVLNDAHRRMNESDYRERPVGQLQHFTIGNKVQGNMARGNLTMPGMNAAGGDVNAAGVLHKGKKTLDMVSNNQANNEERDDESDRGLPRPRRRRGRGRIAAEVISLVSSSPIREAAENPHQEEKVVKPKQVVKSKEAVNPKQDVKSKEAVKRKATVIFTLTVNVMNTDITVPVTVNMTLADTISTAVGTSILKGCDPTGFVLAETNGEIWDSQKWNDVWVEAARGKVRTWSVELKAEKM